jgi:hypothetical protein
MKERANSCLLSRVKGHMLSLDIAHKFSAVKRREHNAFSSTGEDKKKRSRQWMMGKCGRTALERNGLSDFTIAFRRDARRHREFTFGALYGFRSRGSATTEKVSLSTVLQVLAS